MSLKIDAITIGVSDMNRARQFYGEGLGCSIAQDHDVFVRFTLGDGSSSLALYTWDALAADAGVAADGSGFRGIAFNYFVPSAERVDEVLAAAERAGGRIVKAAAPHKQWGGYAGHFSDPDGYLWKVVATS